MRDKHTNPRGNQESDNQVARCRYCITNLGQHVGDFDEICSQKVQNYCGLNENKDLVPFSPSMDWWVHMDYQKLNSQTERYHLPMLFKDQIQINWSIRGCIILIMVTQGIVKFVVFLNIDRKQHFHALVGPFSLKVCLLGYAMHSLPLKVLSHVYFRIWRRTLQKYS